MCFLCCSRCLSSCLKLLVVNKFGYNGNFSGCKCTTLNLLQVHCKNETLGSGLIKQSDHIVHKLICDTPFHNYGFSTVSRQRLYTTSDSTWAALTMFLSDVSHPTQHQFVLATSFKDLISHFMCMDVLPPCFLCSMCLPSTCRGQQKASDPSELVLQMAAGHLMSVGNITRVRWKSSQ